jgi:hypothetical protein
VAPFYSLLGIYSFTYTFNVLVNHCDPPQPWTLYDRFIKEEPSYELFESELIEDPIDIKPNLGQFRQQQFIENDDYIDDSNFDEEKPLKIPKKRKKFSNGE